ncbi:MAG: PAAR domain-containing protein, partial [Halobacteriota archaeon]
AARAGDLTSHGSPLGPGPGSSNVLLGGAPAWRAGSDFHACPLASGLVPHVGGVIVMGSPSVLINGLPAARVGDTIGEGAPPNTIISGCPTILIG